MLRKVIQTSIDRLSQREQDRKRTTSMSHSIPGGRQWRLMKIFDKARSVKCGYSYARDVIDDD